MTPAFCSACGAQLSLAEPDRRATVVHCSHCGGSFPGTPADEARASVPKPDTVHERRDAQGLVLQLGTRYDKRMILLLGFFALAAFALFGSFFGTASPGPATNSATFVGFGLAIVLVVVIVALPMLLAVGGVVNRTRLGLTDRTLRVSHHPISLPRPKELPVAAIDQLYVSSLEEKAKGGQTITFYTLNAIDRDGRNHTLSTSAIHLDEALYLEQQIERAIGLKDRSVAQEAPA